MSRAAAVSAPLELGTAARHLDRGLNRRLYTKMFLRSLVRKSMAKLAHYPGLFDATRVRAASTFYEFDGKRIQSEKHAILRSDTGKELGSFKDGYQPHDYSEWLIHNIGTLMDTSTGDLGIGSEESEFDGSGTAVWVGIGPRLRPGRLFGRGRDRLAGWLGSGCGRSR
jgi:hypothetical protein